MKTPDEIKQSLKVCMLNEASCEGCAYSGYGCCTKLTSDALAYINQLENQFGDATKMVAPAEPAPKWINVEDSLPSDAEAEKFLVVFERKVGRTVEMARYMNGHLTLLAFEAPDGIITHWMPLPEPPKEETK